MNEKQWVEIGTLGRPFGLNGGMWIYLHGPESALLAQTQVPLRLVQPSKSMEVILNKWDGHGRVWFFDYESRTQVEPLVGALVFARREDFELPLENEVYLVDMIGYEAFDQDNLVGTIVGFSETPQILCHIKSKTGDEWMIPFVSPILEEVNHTQKKVIFHLPLGLMDL